MKTLHLKLKKDVLIVDLPRISDYEFINRDAKYLRVNDEEIKVGSTLDNWQLLCKGEELTEEQCKQLIPIEDKDSAKKYPKAFKLSYTRFKNAFIDVVEGEGYHWLVNPYKEDWNDNLEEHLTKFNIWKEAESRTLKHPLIFIKNI